MPRLQINTFQRTEQPIDYQTLVTTTDNFQRYIDNNAEWVDTRVNIPLSPNINYSIDANNYIVDDISSSFAKKYFYVENTDPNYIKIKRVKEKIEKQEFSI